MPSTRAPGHAAFGEVLDHVIGDRADMAVRPAGGHDHEVRNRGFAGKIDGDGVLGLHIVEAMEDQAKGLLGVRSHLGDGFGRTTGGGPERLQVWTGVLSFRCVESPESGSSTLR